MRLPAVPGITPVPTGSVERATEELLAAMVRARGRDAARDPALAIAATEAAELADRHDAGLVAVVEHPDADPAVLTAWVVPTAGRIDPAAADGLSRHLTEAATADGTQDIREVTRTETAAGYPVVIAERIPVGGPLAGAQLAGAQLQVLVFDPAAARMAVFTLHSTTGRGWLELAALTGRCVTEMRFSGPAPAPGTRAGSARRLSGTSGRSARR